MKKIVYLISMFVMATMVMGDVNISQTITADGDVHHNMEIIATGDVYTNANVTHVNIEQKEEYYIHQGDDEMSSLLKMVEIFEEENIESLRPKEKDFMNRFMKFMVYLFHYFHDQHRDDVETMKLELKAVQLLHNASTLCHAELVVANMNNMPEYTCKDGVTHYTDGNGGWMTIGLVR